MVTRSLARQALTQRKRCVPWRRPGNAHCPTTAILSASAASTTFAPWLPRAGLTPAGALVVGTRVHQGALYFCASNPFNSTSKVWAYNLGTKAKQAEFAFPPGFCNDLAFDAAGNLFATSNQFGPAAQDNIYKLSASVLSTGTATSASWATWYTAPSGTSLNGLVFDAANNRLLWANNSTPSATSIQSSNTNASSASPTAVVTNLALDIDGLQLTSLGNLLAIDATAGEGAKLINLATGAAGTVTKLTDGSSCATTVAVYKGDGWCSDSVGVVLRLVGAGGL